jgi:hypothetical protein
MVVKWAGYTALYRFIEFNEVLPVLTSSDALHGAAPAC